MAVVREISNNGCCIRIHNDYVNTSKDYLKSTERRLSKIISKAVLENKEVLEVIKKIN